MQIYKCCKSVDLTDCYEVEIQASKDLTKIDDTIFIVFCDGHIEYEDSVVEHILKKLSNPDVITVDYRKYTGMERV